MADKSMIQEVRISIRKRAATSVSGAGKTGKIPCKRSILDYSLTLCTKNKLKIQI